MSEECDLEFTKKVRELFLNDKDILRKLVSEARLQDLVVVRPRKPFLEITFSSFAQSMVWVALLIVFFCAHAPAWFILIFALVSLILILSTVLEWGVTNIYAAYASLVSIYALMIAGVNYFNGSLPSILLNILLGLFLIEVALALTLAWSVKHLLKI